MRNSSSCFPRGHCSGFFSPGSGETTSVSVTDSESCKLNLLLFGTSQCLNSSLIISEDCAALPDHTSMWSMGLWQGKAGYFHRNKLYTDILTSYWDMKEPEILAGNIQSWILQLILHIYHVTLFSQCYSKPNHTRPFTFKQQRKLIGWRQQLI